jgi:UDP-N-acetylmuramyl tripeptide synthase
MTGAPEASTHLHRRLNFARHCARAAGTLSRRLHHGSGLVISGRLLLAIEPRTVAALSRGRAITLISGTNGKTTTTCLTVAALGNSVSVATNSDGSNTGAAVAGVLASTDAPQLVLEVDEGWLPWAVQETHPEVVLLTNLSRDQLSRHHEVGALAAAWRQALCDVPLVIANADDPAVTWAALAAQGQKWISVGSAWRADSSVCPSCGGRCETSGSTWECLSCGLRRPEPHWHLDGNTLRGADVEVELAPHLPGRFNVANAAMATVAAEMIGSVPARDAAARLCTVTSVAGRFEQVHVHGHDLRIMLAKNPAGWLELLELMGGDRHPLVLVFNAEGVDGRDPSWLYDVSFAPLQGRRVAVQGDRATDLLVRLEHDGVTAQHIPGPLAAAMWRLPAGRVDVVGNYSAFRRVVQEIRRG